MYFREKMSWLPFRKHPKKAIAELIGDNEFDLQVQKFAKIEANTRKMYKDVKHNVEDNSGLLKAQQKLAQELTTNANAVEGELALNSVTENIQRTLLKQAECQTELNSNIRKAVIEPMKKFSGNFNSINSAIKRREQSLQDYTKYLNRREKFIEKDGQPQSGKFDANERYLALAKADFERRNTKLLQELPKFHECRLTYFDPCLEGLIKSQYSYYKQTRDIFEELSEKVDCPTEQWTDEQYKEETRRRLNEIKALSIVAEK
ncbi:bridging integrator 3-like [Hydractinia symbiolongicarpus]|uniref:bridging integrator 3-like n=1 Tax=Hydractinia symbiolongicarpus TaxID=13093 RepID=UPI002551A219|nr:bridging integrator 3-like [Hydractinia symbiolongicarpus]